MTVMSLRSQLALATLSILATAALAATAADARPGQGRGQRPQPSAPVVQEVAPQVESPSAAAATPEVTLETTESVLVESLEVETSEPESAVVSTTAEEQTLPPGLQRQVASDRGLPPGLQRQAASDRGLPPGLQRSR
ncbi:hypothetical protein H6F75_25815 [Nodosilinea sp. FACHB-131]|uniref:hypothetical protein n=1 Tax=Cyanophyceae TaxID=3028117 RepID=UPI001684C047|nr:hypothetical protein [Nodosilinea sp. FACHB-131]MBD1876908.1 hypothetical protein [Nodosilinea sp. FACHB-131]